MSLRIALLGSRGIPARYGGYETLYEELAPRLAERGHRVTVYCRSHYTPSDLESYRGVRLRVLPTLRTKHLDTPVHTALSVIDAAQGGFDAALVVNAANAAFTALLRDHVPVALHVDGIERRRDKWGPLGRSVYAISERLAPHCCDQLICDAGVIADYYRRHFGVSSSLITYGVERDSAPGDDVLGELGLESGHFILYVSRFEEENNPHRVVEAYRHAPGDYPLVMVGDAPYAGSFIRSFRDRADPRVLFPGAIYGSRYRQLQHHAKAYIHATEVGGTHPALVEAMGYGNCILVNDTPENRETVAEHGLFFNAEDPHSLSRHLEWVINHPLDAYERGRQAADYARRTYSWDRITDLYEDVFSQLANSR